MERREVRSLIIPPFMPVSLLIFCGSEKWLESFGFISLVLAGCMGVFKKWAETVKLFHKTG